MAKKEHSHHPQHHAEHHPHPEPRLEEAILHNLVELQKVHISLAEKFDKLSSNISQLLALFEGAAKTFTKQNPQVSDKDRDFLEKIDKLLEQNKTIARGLMLMEDRMRERMHTQPNTGMSQSPFAPQNQNRTEMPRPLPKL